MERRGSALSRRFYRKIWFFWSIHYIYKRDYKIKIKGAQCSEVYSKDKAAIKQKEKAWHDDAHSVRYKDKSGWTAQLTSYFYPSTSW